LGDWTEQEVIELRRVQSVLERAGVATDTNFGLSDEGDPWCVICRMGSTEVLAHFARIDGTYVGYWEGFNYGRSGDSLHDVSDHFLERIPVMLHIQRERRSWHKLWLRVFVQIVRSAE
jgi:hypothetical protein